MGYLESIASRVQLLLESSEVRERFENAVHDYVESLTEPDTDEHSEHSGDMYSGEPTRHLIPCLSNVDSQDKKAVVLFAVWCFVNEIEWNKPPLVELRFTEIKRDARYVGKKPDLVKHFQYEIWKHQVRGVKNIDSKQEEVLFQYIDDVKDHFGIHAPKDRSSKEYSSGGTTLGHPELKGNLFRWGDEEYPLTKNQTKVMKRYIKEYKHNPESLLKGKTVLDDPNIDIFIKQLSKVFDGNPVWKFFDQPKKGYYRLKWPTNKT